MVSLKKKSWIYEFFKILLRVFLYSFLCKIYFQKISRIIHFILVLADLRPDLYYEFSQKPVSEN